jgi:thiamine pyrophosphate-dependent acetolactate synthase large subunit-like protein
MLRVDADELLRHGADGCVVVLAGPRVVDDGALDALRSFAAAGALGVANTWGAKGVFGWDSPHHLGTCGLQAHDFELLGWGDADLIVTTGLTDEVTPDRYALAPVVDLAPSALADALGKVRADRTPTNDLYPRLAAIARPGYVDDKVPLHPARASADLGKALPVGGLVSADPGVAGLWVARTFPTPALAPGSPRRVVVPATREAGVAVRLATGAARAGRPAIAVTTAPLDAETFAGIDAAADESLDLVVAIWQDSGSLPDAAAHAAHLINALDAPGVTVVEVPVALADTRVLVEAAGDVVAWGGIG